MLVLDGVLMNVDENDLELLYNNPKEFWNGVTDIGDFAFYELPIEKIEIPSQIVSIGNSAFQHCESLKEIILNRGLNEIKEFAFSACISLEEIFLPESLEILNDGCFGYCKNLRFVGLPYSLKKVCSYSFWSCSKLRVLNFKDNVVSIGVAAFGECSKLTEIALPRKIEVLPDKVLKNCVLLRNLNVGENLNKISKSAITGCKRLNRIRILNDKNKEVFSLDRDVLESLKNGTLRCDLEKNGNAYEKSEMGFER